MIDLDTPYDLSFIRCDPFEKLARGHTFAIKHAFSISMQEDIDVLQVCL